MTHNLHPARTITDPVTGKVYPVVCGGSTDTDAPVDVETMTHTQIVNRLRDVQDDLEHLSTKAEKRGFLEEADEQRWADLTAEFELLDVARKAREREADMDRVKARMTGRRTSRVATEPGSGPDAIRQIPEPDSVEQRRFRDPYDLSEIRSGLSDEERGVELRARALSAIERLPFVDDKRRKAASDIVERWDNKAAHMAKLVLSTSSEDYVRAFGALLAANGQVGMLADKDREVIQRAIALDPTSAGGYLMPFQLDPSVINTADGSVNQVRQIARQVVATGNKWHGVSSGGVTSRWGPEATQAADNSPTFAQPEVEVHKLDIFVPISIEALADAVNVAQEVAQMIAFEADRRESIAFVTGTGDGQPFGIVTALEAAAPSVVVPTAAAGVFDAEDIYALDGALPARHRMAASWLGGRRTYNAVRQFDEAGGGSLWVQLQQDVPPLLLGRRAYESEEMATELEADNSILVYGDFSNFVVADRIGTTVEFIPHLVGADRRPTGQRGWYAYKRVGANSVNDGAFRVLQAADS